MLVEQIGEELADLAPEEVGDGLRHDLQSQRIARIPLDEAGPLLWGTDHLILRQQLLARGGLQPGQAQRAHRGPQLGGFLPRGEQQTTLVRRFGDPPQQPSVPLQAGTQMSPDIAFREQGFQVVQNQQDTRGPQVLQQEADASFEAGKHDAQRLRGEHLEALIQERFAGGGITQRAKDHHLEVRSQLVHRADHQR